jgi:hypothetical protein
VAGPDLSDWAVVLARKSRFLCASRFGMTRGMGYDTSFRPHLAEKIGDSRPESPPDSELVRAGELAHPFP